MNKYTIGRVVLSTKGRDCGKHFLIVELISDEYVMIVDGKTHKLDNPKLKKVKHLKAMDQSIESIAEKILLAKQVFDQEINKLLREFNSQE